MTSNPLRNGLAAEGLPAERDWLPLAAFVFVILALVALAVTPALLLQRISRVTDDVTTTLLPAYDGMRDFAFAMEQRISSARSRFLTDDPLYDRRLAEARAAEAEALQTLQALAPRPGRWAAIQVSDTGPGIPPEQREAIFDEFTRPDDASSTKGHGLGLAIARRLARLLGGDLTVSDAPNGGATFILWLPCREESASPAEDIPPTASRRYDA